MSVPFMFVDGNLTLVLGNKTHQVLKDHVNYKMIMEVLPTATAEELVELVDVQKAVQVYSSGRVTVENDTVKCDGEVVHGTIAKRILEFMSNGLPFEPLVKFLENISENPSYQSQVELYDFLEHKNLPITDDGCFLAYKAVRKDFKDKYKGVFDNSVGQICEMSRSKVDDNRNMGCSAGLHVGALDYVASYGSPEAEDNIIIVKVNPRDAVSVPTDSSHQKLRTCRYEVVGLYEGELKRPVYHATLEDGYDPYYDDEDEDWDEDHPEGYDYEEEEYDQDYWDQF